jgi:hypothetical protein
MPRIFQDSFKLITFLVALEQVIYFGNKVIFGAFY